MSKVSIARNPEIGVMFRRDQDPPTLIAAARRVEAMGFDHLWVVEDCFYLGGIAQAAIALAATNRLRIGIGINPGVARNAAFLAMEYATLAHAFPGRFIGGIGHGVAGWMDQVGARPASWLTSIEEITTAVRRILRGERVDVDGEYVRLSGVRLESPPTTAPQVLLGVRGEKSLRLAGACADGVALASFSGPDYVRWAVEVVAAGWAEAGRAGSPMVVVNAACDVDDIDPAAALDRTRARIAAMNGDGLTTAVSRMPFAAEMEAMVARGGRDMLAAGMPDDWIRSLAVAGTVAEARESVARLAEAGADAVVLTPPDGVVWTEWLEAQSWSVARF